MGAVDAGRTGPHTPETTIARLRWRGMGEFGVASATSYRTRSAEAEPHLGMPAPRLTLILGFAEPIGLRTGPPDAAPDAALDRAPDRALDGASGSTREAERLMVSCVAGLHSGAVRLTMPRHQDGLQLSLDPLRVRTLLGMPAAALPLHGEEPETVLGPALRELLERLGETVDLPGPQRSARRAEILRRWTLGRARSGAPADARSGADAEIRPEVARAWRVITARRGDCRVGELARHVLLSERQLRTLMRAELGISPKTACRLARFDHALERLVEGTDASLADTAAACGYADHAHLDADFRAATGLAPTAWLAAEGHHLAAGGHRNRPEA